ncbi:MAG TPA: hypothetical protein VJT71_10995 [Pyrinomonadaceae bacterium]|nr:hypothetical protein [Pyrinomonadaceae bacterium]
MTEPNVTLRDVFELPKDGAPDPEPARWQAVQDRIRKEVKDVKLPAKMHDLGPKILELFDVPLPTVLVTSWKKAGSLQEIIAQSREAPDEVKYLELAEHTINCEQKPHIEMRIKNLPVKKIQFVVKLLFKLKGFVLKVQNGAIKEIQTGNFEAKGTVSFAGQIILEKKLSPINLPGRVDVPALIGEIQSVSLASQPIAKAQSV